MLCLCSREEPLGDDSIVPNTAQLLVPIRLHLLLNPISYASENRTRSGPLKLSSPFFSHDCDCVWPWSKLMMTKKNSIGGRAMFRRVRPRPSAHLLRVLTGYFNHHYSYANCFSSKTECPSSFPLFSGKPSHAGHGCGWQRAHTATAAAAFYPTQMNERA